MQVARASACSATLADGRLLVAGGAGVSGALDTVELYGTDGAFNSASHLSTPRSQASCVTLQDGRVLIAGGLSGDAALASAEVYDPSTGAWQSTGSMAVARSGHQMALTPWGAVVIAGGEPSGTVELFLPDDGVFQVAGQLSSARLKAAIAILPQRRVIFAGGSDGVRTLSSVDIYDAATNTIAPAGKMLHARRSFAAAALLDGAVWITGGLDGDGRVLGSSEVFDPTEGVSVAGPDLSEPRANHVASLLPANGGVLVTGGTGASGTLASAELYTSWNGQLATLPAMNTARYGLVAAPVSTGNLVVAGGRNPAGYLASSELFGFATIQSDRPDYRPGDTATFLGTGWTPGERVQVQVTAFPPDAHGIEFTGSGVADGSGRAIIGGFGINQSHFGMQFRVTARGSVSQAQYPFSDGDNTQINITSTNPLPPQQYTTPVTFNGTVMDTNTSTGVNGGTITVTYHGVGFANNTAPVDGAGNFSFTFNASTEFLPAGFNVNRIGFAYSPTSPGYNGSAATASYRITPYTLTFTVVIGQPGLPAVAPPPGLPATVTASTGQIAGNFPCGGVILCQNSVCSGGVQTLSSGVAVFDVPLGFSSSTKFVGVLYEDTCDANFTAPETDVPYGAFPTTASVTFLSGASPVTTVSYASPTTFVANISAGDICTGTVQFVVDGTPIAPSVAVVAGNPIGNITGCTATYTVPGGTPLALGPHTIAANYSGDALNTASSNSAGLIVTAPNLPPTPGNDDIQIFTAASSYQARFASTGAGTGQVRTPCGVAIDPIANNIFVADYLNGRIEEWSSAGQWIGSFSSRGAGNGQVQNPCGLAFAPNGNLYVADAGNSRVDIFMPMNTVRTSWNSTTFFGGPGSAPGRMSAPLGLAILPGGSSSNFTVYVADTGNNRIEFFTATGGYLGVFGQSGNQNGQFVSPAALAFAPGNLLLVADFGNNRIEVLTTSGAYLNQFGNNGPAQALLQGPFAIGVAPATSGSPYAGNIMVTDSGHSRVVIFNSGGQYVSQYGNFGTGNGQFKTPLGIAFFANGSRVVSD